jgi:hypothetical protein
MFYKWLGIFWLGEQVFAFQEGLWNFTHYMVVVYISEYLGDYIVHIEIKSENG